MTTAPLPDHFTLVWLFFTQPTVLRERLIACGIEEPGASARYLWDSESSTEVHETYVNELLILFIWFTAAGTLFLASLTYWVGYTVDFEGAIVGVVLALLLGSACAFIWSLPLGVAFGCLGGIAFSLGGSLFIGLLGSALGETQAYLVGGVIDGIAEGIASGLSEGLALGIALSLMSGNVVCIGVARRLLFGLALGVVGGMVVGEMADLINGTQNSFVFAIAYSLVFLPFFQLGYQYYILPTDDLLLDEMESDLE